MDGAAKSPVVLSGCQVKNSSLDSTSITIDTAPAGRDKAEPARVSAQFFRLIVKKPLARGGIAKSKNNKSS